MIENQDIRPVQVIGPLGEPLTLADLPSPETKRWVVRRKAEVVAAVNGGLLTLDEALARYGLTLEEFASWQRAVDRSGMHGLRVTKIQHYRDLYQRQFEILSPRGPLDDSLIRARPASIASSRQGHAGPCRIWRNAMGWIIALIVGGIAGWLASLVMNRDASMGIFWNIVVGCGRLGGRAMSSPARCSG